MRPFALVLMLSLSSAPALAQAPQAKPIAPEQLDAALAQVESTAELERLAMQLTAAGEHGQAAKVWKRLATLRPHLGRYRLNEAAAYAEQGMRSETYNALLGLQNQGYAFSLTNDDRFAKARGTEVWDYIVGGFDTNAKPFGEGGVTHTLPREDLLIESLAWDPKRGQLLVGGARDGKVHLVEADGKLKPLAAADEDNGMWAVFDIAVDAERRVLWVASTAVPHYRGYDAEQDLGRAGIFKFDLDSGKFLKKFLSPTMAGQSFFMSTLTVAPDGAVFAADGVNNAVYQVRDDSFSRLFHAPRLTSIRDLTTSPDGKTLYFADHQLGLFGFSLEDGKPFDIPVPERQTLGGIDGVQWWNGHLLLVQNGLPPNRVVRAKLSANGRVIEAMQPLEANKPELALPTLGTMGADDRFYFIANSQKAAYDRFGLPRNKHKLQPTRIYAIDADFAMEAQKE